MSSRALLLTLTFALTSFACGAELEEGSAESAAFSANLPIVPPPAPCMLFYTWVAANNAQIQTNWVLAARNLALASQTVLRGPLDEMHGQPYGGGMEGTVYVFQDYVEPVKIWLSRPTVQTASGPRYGDPIVKLGSAHSWFTGVVSECSVSGNTATIVAVSQDDARVIMKMTPGAILQ